MTKKYDNSTAWAKNHRINNNGVIERQCTNSKCKKWLEENEENFYLKNKKNPEKGYSPECKICAVKRSTIVQQNNFERSKAAKHKHYLNNLDKWYDRRIAYYETHSNTEIQQRWYENNPEKAYSSGEFRRLHKKHDINDEQWEICKDYFKDENGEQCCAYCGLPISKHLVKRKDKIISMDFHKEHVDDEGSNGLDNCVPSCRTCNSSKRQYKLGVWFSPKNKRRGGKVFSEEKLNKIFQWMFEDCKEYIIEVEKFPYRITRKRVYKNDNTYNFKHELWSVNDNGDMIECIATANKKNGLKEYITKHFSKSA